MPDLYGLTSVSLSGTVFEIPLTNGRPSPSSRGLTTNWYSSIKSFCASWETMVPLPKIMMSDPGSCLMRSTSRGSNFGRSREFFHLTSFSVLEKTIFVASLM